MSDSSFNRPTDGRRIRSVEVFPGGTPLWRGCARGRESALAALETLGRQTVNECFAAELSTETIIGRVNNPLSE
jgi:hypothetical protein